MSGDDFFETRIIKRLAFACLVLAALRAAGAEAPRTWSPRAGAPFEASLLAADGLRATFDLPARGKAVVALADLSLQDAGFVREWRAASRRRPLIDPDRLAPWPAQAAAESTEARFVGEDAGTFVFESAHFRLISELKLPLGTVRDLATVFEATRALLIALPLGTHAGGEREKYPVHFAATAESYQQLGGAGGSGGSYDPRRRRMLVLLPNLGIEQRPTGLVLDHRRNLFVLRHEVTHQLLAPWQAPWPMWLHEGFAEFVAALPFAQDRYTLSNPGAGLHSYVLKWRTKRDGRTLRLVPPARLMAISGSEWLQSVEQTSAYDCYNSAALLTWFFLQQDGGRPFAAFIDALRRGVPVEEAERVHLLRGKSREALAVEVMALAKRMGLEVKLAD